jgi:hypothetical protein
VVLAPIAALEYLKAALPINHSLGVGVAQLDLTNWPAAQSTFSAIRVARFGSCALCTARRIGTDECERS